MPTSFTAYQCNHCNKFFDPKKTPFIHCEHLKIHTNGFRKNDYKKDTINLIETIDRSDLCFCDKNCLIYFIQEPKSI